MENSKGTQKKLFLLHKPIFMILVNIVTIHVYFMKPGEHVIYLKMIFFFAWKINLK
ncbi:hypothetical protein Hdeb2414_s0008g00286061 [Helianthus debilis subsp. tardiflorus]